MDWDAIGAIGELVSAAAVLATLIYLSVQITQARGMQQAEAIRATRAERREFFTSMRDSPYIPEIFEKLNIGTELTYAENHRLVSHLAAHWGTVYSAWIQDKLGLTGGYNTAMAPNIRFALSQPGSVEWMKEYGKDLYPKEFFDEAMSHLESGGTWKSPYLVSAIEKS